MRLKRLISCLLSAALLAGLLVFPPASASGSGGFSDISDSTVADAAEMLRLLGVVDGTGGGAFSPAAEITLEQMVTVLWRYAGSPAAEAAVPDSLGAVSDWAAGAMSWAAETGLLDGVGGSLTAQAPASRAQVAQVMMNNAQERSA